MENELSEVDINAILMFILAHQKIKHQLVINLQPNTTYLKTSQSRETIHSAHGLSTS